MITHKQLTLAEVFEDCQNKFDNDKYQFLSLAQGTSAPAYFFNPDGHAPDCVLKILSGTS